MHRILMKICSECLHLDEYLCQVQIWVMSGLKTRSVGQIIDKPCEHSTGHIMHPIIMKICPNVCLDEISQSSSEYGSCWVKN